LLALPILPLLGRGAFEVCLYGTRMVFKSTPARLGQLMKAPVRENKTEPPSAASGDVTEWKRSEELLRGLAEATAGVTGREFFRSLARHAASALKVRYTFL